MDQSSTMFRPRLLSAAPFLLLVIPGCHPPDKQIYLDSVHCIGVLDTALKLVPAAEFARAGVDRFDVDKAAAGSFDDALKFGANFGLQAPQVRRDVDLAEQQVFASYTARRSTIAEGDIPRLIAAVKPCLPQPEKPNND